MSAARRSKSPRAPDPGTVCRELCDRAGRGELPRLLLLLPPARGEEEAWFAEQVLDAARQWARAQEGLDLLELDGGSPDFEPAVLEEFLGAASLFGSGRALLLGRAGKALNRWPRLIESLGAAAADPAGPAPIAVQAAGLLKAPRDALDAVRKKAGKSVELHRFRRLYGDPPPWNPDPDQSEAARFAGEEARRRGVTLEPGAPGLLVQLAGARPAQLCQALQHFALLGLDSVAEGDIRSVAAHSAEGSAFEFSEAVLRGEADGALRCLARLRARGLRTWDGRRLGSQEAFGLMLSVLAGERRRTAAVRAALDGGAEFTDACKAAGVAAGGPPAQRMRQRLDRCGAGQLERVLDGIRRTERHVKREGWRDTLHALEWLALHAHRDRAASGAGR